MDALQEKQYLKIQKIHHKALKVYNSNKNYDELLRDNNEVSIHQSHLRALICEIFKSLNNLNSSFMWLFFVFRNITYNIRKSPLLRLPAAKSTSYGINSAHVYFGTVCANLLNTVNLLLN